MLRQRHSSRTKAPQSVSAAANLEEDLWRSSFPDRELANILSAQRNWQSDALNEGLAEAFSGHIEGHKPLADDEIDGYCQRVNFGDYEVLTKAPT